MAKKFGVTPAASTLTDITGGGLATNAAGDYLLNIVNRGTSTRKVRIAVTDGAAATTADYIEWDAILLAAGTEGNVLSRWPIPLGSGHKVWIYADGVDITAMLIGQED